MVSKAEKSNAELAAVLDEVARRLRAQAANPFRVSAYKKAAATLRRLRRPAAEIFRESGQNGLANLPGIGKSLARSIARLLRGNRLPQLEALRQKELREDRLASLPNVGPRLADRIRAALGDDSLEEVFRAAYDGRLARVPGVGRKRVQAIRESLSWRLERKPPPAKMKPSTAPPVAILLDIDREYRERAAEGRLLLVSPKKFNPTRAAWLPVLRTKRNGRRYSAMYSNTSRSHRLSHTGDWVVIYCEEKEFAGQWTVVTAQYGSLRGRRIVRGREKDCQEHYSRKTPEQLSLL